MEESYDYIIVDYDPVTGECEPVHPSAISEPPNTLPRHLRRNWKAIFNEIQPIVGNYDANRAASRAIEREYKPRNESTSRELTRSTRGRRRAYNKEIEKMVSRYKKKFNAKTPSDFSEEQLSAMDFEAEMLCEKWCL